MEYNENIIYLIHFIIERYRIFIRKAAKEQSPWTADPILADYKFTNIFRFLDFESQYLIRNVIGSDRRSIDDTIYRILLFKMFNLSTTWEFLEHKVGDINTSVGLDEIELALIEWSNSGNKIFSNAYSKSSTYNLTDEAKAYRLDGGISNVGYFLSYYNAIFTEENMINIKSSATLEKLCKALQGINGVGGFMSYQFAQDLNYSKHFNHDMNSYVEEGAGSIRGINRCFGKVKDYKAVLQWVYDNIYNLIDKFSDTSDVSFNGHLLQLPDIQNCFCEVDKYMRGAGINSDGVAGKSIKQKYSHNNSRLIDKYVAPPKWRVEPLYC